MLKAGRVIRATGQRGGTRLIVNRVASAASPFFSHLVPFVLRKKRFGRGGGGGGAGPIRFKLAVLAIIAPASEPVLARLIVPVAWRGARRGDIAQWRRERYENRSFSCRIFLRGAA